MPYSRDQTVAEVLSLYEFLVSMYLPEDALKRAPAGGWPSINSTRLAFMEKSESVIDLMKHLPYVRRDELYDPYQIHYECVCNDYTGQFFERNVREQHSLHFEPLDGSIGHGAVCKNIAGESAAATDDALPGPHVLALASTRHIYGWWIFINTQDGVVSMMDAAYGDERMFENIQDFVEFVKDEFRSLALVPLKPDRIRHSDSDPYGVVETYRKYHWPSAAFKKQDCLAEIADRRTRYDLDEFCVRELMSFYEYLAKMYLPEDALKRAPVKGWPSITSEAIIGKSEVAINLMKQLPYIQSRQHDKPYQIYASTACNDFTNGENHEDLTPGPHMLTIAKPVGGHGLYVCLNAEDGVVTTVSSDTGEEHVYSDISEFTHPIKVKLMDLEIVPITPYEILQADTGGAVVAEVREVYDRHNWFNGRFFKDECQAELKTIMGEDHDEE